MGPVAQIGREMGPDAEPLRFSLAAGRTALPSLPPRDPPGPATPASWIAPTNPAAPACGRRSC